MSYVLFNSFLDLKTHLQLLIFPMQNSSVTNLPSFTFNTPNLSLLYPQLIQNLKLLNHQQCQFQNHLLQSQLAEQSSLDKRKFESLDSAFSKATEKKIATAFPPTILSSILKSHSLQSDSSLASSTQTSSQPLSKFPQSSPLNALLQSHLQQMTDYKSILQNKAPTPSSILLQQFSQQVNSNILNNNLHSIAKENSPKTTSAIALIHENEEATKLSKMNQKGIEGSTDISEEIQTQKNDEETAMNSLETPVDYKHEPIIVDPPALVEFTKDFPTWDLAKIFNFVNKGKTKDDLVVRETRNKDKKISYTREFEAYDELAERKRMIQRKKELKEKAAAKEKRMKNDDYLENLCQFQLELNRVFGSAELNQAKVLELFKKCKMDPKKSISVIENDIHKYKNELILQKSN